MKPSTNDAEKKVRELLDFAKVHGLTEMAWADKDVRVSFRRNLGTKEKKKILISSNGKETPLKTIVSDEEVIRSPMVGTFRRATSKDRPSLILEGNRVKPGERLGVVECMKIPTDVVNLTEGVLAKILVGDGQVVEYGQPLFLIKLASEGNEPI
jgi:biotin carboxyl carrier protein